MDTNELARSLPAALATVPDPRSPQGKRHPLPAILTLAVCAMLSGARSLYAICQWGRQQNPGYCITLKSNPLKSNPLKSKSPRTTH